MRHNIVYLLVLVLFSLAFAQPPLLAQAQAGNPQPAFEAALDSINQNKSLDEQYAIGEMRVEGAWAYAIATHVTSHSDQADTPHTFLAMIAVLDGGHWTVTMGTPANANVFNALLATLPATLMDPFTKDFISQPAQSVHSSPLAADNMSGHRLPWRKGLQAFISQRDGSGHANQVDFDIQGLIASGDVVASKAGTVIFVKESSNNGSCDGSNFSNVWKQTNVVVVRHSASEYSWYVHLAYNSATVQVGDEVSAGAKLGVEGATGFACGIHLHYMASSAIPASWTDPNNPNAAPWPPSGSITQVDFDESPWLALAQGAWITSQNDGITPCSAPAIQAPADGALITSTVINASWSAVSNCAFNGYIVRVKDVTDANAGGNIIAGLNTNALTATLALDAAWAYRDVYVHVRANAAGAAWSTRRVQWAPVPNGKYTLHENADFSGAVFSSSQTITQLASVDFDNVARSMQLDAGVGVVLCSEPNLRGDCGRALGPIDVSTLDSLASGLGGNVSSVRACFGACPAAPITPTLVSPINSAIAFSGTILLKWQGAGEEFQVEVAGGELTATLQLTWASGAQRIVTLPASMQPYQWRVRSANDAGSGPWAAGSFRVVEATQHVYLPVAIR